MNKSIQIFKMTDYAFRTFDKNSINQNDLLFINVSWHCSPKAIDVVNTKICDNIIILANSQEEKDYYENIIDTDVLFCNKNAFLDENIYSIDMSIPKKYDLLINSCFSKYKNVHIASKCKNTIHIGYYNGSNITYPVFGKYLNFRNNIKNKKNHSILTKPEIIKYSNESYVGGIFSLLEGQCRASSEYLLCGMPVVSPKSKGGRDVWYNEQNSIICDFTQESVFDCVNLAKQYVIDGTFNAETIRNNHILQSYDHRNTIMNYINDYLVDQKENPTTFEDLSHILFNV
jgi:hypothetical protein